MKLVLEGPGIPRVEKTVRGGDAFVFETPGFQPGAATLTATCGAETRVRKIRRIVPNGRRMSWIENGHLVIDGRPTIRRTIEAPHYRTTEPLRERESVRKLHLTPEAEIVGIETGRLIRGSEQTEGVFDRAPSKEMFAAIDRRMAEWKDRDFCGWYLCDEPECRSISPVYLRHVYRYVSERDPHHVCFICSRDAVRYIDACDAIEPHPYLNPRYAADGTRVHSVPLNTYGDFFGCISDANRPDKAVGDTPFAFSYHYDTPSCDYATFDEYVASIWAALAEGCTMFGAFIADAIGDTAGLYRGVEYTYAQMEELEPWLLLGRRTKIARTKDYVATKWEKDGETLLAVVNFQSVSRRVTVPGLKGTFFEFRGDRVVRNVWGRDELLVYLAPYETVVLASKRLPSRYPSLKQVRARIAEEESARLGRDNQLLLRDAELGFASETGRHALPIKLVDGVLDNLGYEPDGAEPQIAISFPGDPLVFDTMRLYGERLDKTVVRAEFAGATKTLAPAKVEKLRDGLVLVFDGVQKADVLRLEFNDRKVRVYELEVPYAADR